MSENLVVKLKAARAELVIRRRQMNAAVRSYSKIFSLIANLERKNERKTKTRVA